MLTGTAASCSTGLCHTCTGVPVILPARRYSLGHPSCWSPSYLSDLLPKLETCAASGPAQNTGVQE